MVNFGCPAIIVPKPTTCRDPPRLDECQIDGDCRRLSKCCMKYCNQMKCLGRWFHPNVFVYGCPNISANTLPPETCPEVLKPDTCSGDEDCDEDEKCGMGGCNRIYCQSK